MKSLKTGTLLVLLALPRIAEAGPLDTWTSRHLRETGNQLTGVTYGNGLFVAVGGGYCTCSDAIILTSADGANWTEQQTGLSFRLEGITYGNNQFVVVGYGGAATSKDATNWILRGTPPGIYLLAVVRGEDRFVTVGGAGNGPAILTSADGFNWIAADVRGLGYISSVAYGNGCYVAAGEWGSAWTSKDGLSWSRSGASLVRNGSTTTGVAFGNGQFLAVSNGGDIFNSVDGVTWVLRRSTKSNESLEGLACGNGRFVAVGYNFSLESETILSSSNGVDWVEHTGGSGNQLFGIAYGNGAFVAVGDNETLSQSGSVIALVTSRSALPGLLTLSLEGPTGLDYTIQSSSDLITWSDVTKISNAQSSKVILDGLPAASERQFYRAFSP